ncbi:cylicin-1 [Sorex araneus]|uniref:cylicin-1 n=1 Tax=Sorex araneus TaxID=42254 RepID=UPI0006492BE8|nr:cylicin-1 [Sorex araneus]
MQLQGPSVDTGSSRTGMNGHRLPLTHPAATPVLGCLGALGPERVGRKKRKVHVGPIFWKQNVDIRKYDNSMPISESRRKLWNQVYCALTFPKSSQPGIIKRSRPTELENTVPRNEKIKLEEIRKPAQIWIRHVLRKTIQRPPFYLIVRRQALFKNIRTLKVHAEKNQSKKFKGNNKVTLKKDFNKSISLLESTPEPIKSVNDEKPKIQNKSDKSPSIATLEIEQSKKIKSKSETNSEFKELDVVSTKDLKNYQEDPKNPKEMDTELMCTKDSKSSKNNADAQSNNCSKCSLNLNLINVDDHCAKSMIVDLCLKNCSQNNSKKTSKKDAKKNENKSSDAESGTSKDAKNDAKKDKKLTKKESKKKNAKDTGSTDAESVDSKDAKKDAKKDKKVTKKESKKKIAKDTGSADAESAESKDEKKDAKKSKKLSKKENKKTDAKKDTGSTDAESLDSKDAKKDKKPPMKSKDTKKDATSTDAESQSDLEGKKSKIEPKIIKTDQKKDEKKDTKKDTASIDADSESEWNLKKEKKDEKMEKIEPKKGEKSPMKSEATTETESDQEAKKDKGLKKTTKQDESKVSASMGAKSDQVPKTSPKRSDMVKSLDVELDAFLYTPASKIQAESDTSTGSKESQELKKDSETVALSTSSDTSEKAMVPCMIPLFRERPPCEPFQPVPKVKRLCPCKMPPPTKPRYAPLPEAKWIHKLL